MVPSITEKECSGDEESNSISSSSDDSDKRTHHELKNDKTSWWNRLHEFVTKWTARVESEGVAFRAALTLEDVQMIKMARLLFHTASVVPPMFYYFLAPFEYPKFPATISFTIRKGPSQKAQLLLWTAGWACMGKVLKSAGSKWVQRFSAQMWLTGIWTTVLFRLGRDPLSDVAHFFGAGAYMADHIVLLRLLNTRPVFRKLFFGSFAVLLASISGTHAVERAAGLPMESDHRTSTTQRARRLARLSAKTRRKLFVWELLVMLSENLLFASFVHGMPSGLLGCEDHDDIIKPSTKEGESAGVVDDTGHRYRAQQSAATAEESNSSGDGNY